MKKTIIALPALGGGAGANTSVTLGSWFTNTESADVYTVDAVQGKSKAEAKNLGLTNADGLSYAGFTFTIDVSNMLSSAQLTENDIIQVTGITLASNSQHNSVQTGKLFITLGEVTYVSETGVEDRDGAYGTLTYSFTGSNSFTLGITDTLNAEIFDTTKVSIGVFQGQTGVGGIDSPTGFASWQPGVKITGTIAVPEPTTATLSLLALAGLAARRRRR